MRYLSRNKIYTKVEPQKDAKKVYIFCEGEEKEVKYFKYFQGFSSNIDIIPIPNIKGKSNPIKLMENAELLFFGSKDESILPRFTLSKDYNDEVWFVIDTDHWNEGNKIQILKDFCLEKNNEFESWYLAQSNPCFELWLYYHFHNSRPIEVEVSKFVSFKEFVHYKIRNGFKLGSDPVELHTAIINSKRNFEIEKDQPKLYSTEVHNLGLTIYPFVRSQLEKAKEMMKNNNTM